MNKVILMGRLTKDPETATSTSGTMYARFSLAVDRRFKRDGESDADFFNCTTFGKNAEFADKYLKKGTKVLVEGRLQNDQYEKDGQKITATKVMIDEIEFAESKGENKSNNSDTNSGTEFLSVPAGLVEELPFS